MNKNYIIFDLEATCHRGGAPKGFDNEIIEIGAVKMNPQGEVIDEFAKFSKPLNFPTLSDFCKELTTITQKDIDGSDNLKDVMESFLEWSSDSIWVSWGHYDKTQMLKDMKSNDIESDIPKHYSLKHLFARWKGRRPVGMSKALRSEGFEIDGTHHRGIDDAKNISKIFIKNLEIFKLTQKYLDKMDKIEISSNKWVKPFVEIQEILKSLKGEKCNDDEKMLVFKILFGKYNNKETSNNIKELLKEFLEPFKEVKMISGFFKALKSNIN